MIGVFRSSGTREVVVHFGRRVALYLGWLWPRFFAVGFRVTQRGLTVLLGIAQVRLFVHRYDVFGTTQNRGSTS